jgi:hypothetical protein
MKHSVLTTAVIVALAGSALLPGTSEAFGRRKASCGQIAPPCSAAPCGAPCAPVVAAPLPAPAPVQYQSVTVTKYKQVMVEKQITELVCRTVTKEVSFKYNVSVPVVTPTKQLVNVCKTVTREVPVTYTVMVPKVVQQTVLCTTYQCVPQVVTRQVPVCRTVRVPCVDACGNCTYTCQRVTEMQTVSCTVMRTVPVQKQVVVNRTICQPVTQTGTKLVCDVVNVQQEVMVNVCSYRTEVREGKRLVCELVTDKVIRKVQVCQVTPYTEVVQVPVAAPCASSSCYQPAASGGGHGHGRRGMFRKSCCN